MPATFNDGVLTVEFERVSERQQQIKSFVQLGKVTAGKAAFDPKEVKILHLIKSDDIVSDDIKKAFPNLETIIVDASPKFTGTNLIFRGGPAHVVFRDSGLKALVHTDRKSPHDDLKSLTVIGCKYVDLNNIVRFLKASANSKADIVFGQRCRNIHIPNFMVDAGVLGLQVSANVITAVTVDLNSEETGRIDIPIEVTEIDHQIQAFAAANNLVLFTVSEHAHLAPASSIDALNISSVFPQPSSNEAEKVAETGERKSTLARILMPVALLAAAIAAAALVIVSKQKLPQHPHKENTPAQTPSVTRVMRTPVSKQNYMPVSFTTNVATPKVTVLEIQATPAPTTPAPATPAPATPAPTTPAPATPAPTTPVPATPVPEMLVLKATPAPEAIPAAVVAEATPRLVPAKTLIQERKDRMKGLLRPDDALNETPKEQMTR